MKVDNSVAVARFCPAADDGDMFIYTEMLDRGQRKGNNGQRLLKTFYHRSVAEFWEQWPTIVKLCDMAQVRACTRLAPRSYKKVGREFTQLVVETAMCENWAGMKSLYNRACGVCAPITKRWLFDVDDKGDEAVAFTAQVYHMGAIWLATIPSKKGWHVITKPFDIRRLGLPASVTLHKDNPTNLYIPEGAD